MYLPLKIKNDPNLLWFVSDTHFNHDRDFIYKRRGFNSVFEHDNMLVERWNQVVPLNGTVFHLGDFIFGKDAINNIDIFLKTLNFRELYLSPGNHFAGWKQKYKECLEEQFGRTDIDIYPLTYTVDVDKVVHFMPNYYEGIVNGRPIVFAHYALACWNGAGHGSYMLCGHSHGNYPDALESAKKGRILDIGIENFGGPISFNKVIDILEKKQIITLDHHNQDTLNPF